MFPGGALMSSTNKRWHVVQQSEFPHEREALELMRGYLPERSPLHAWSNFEFIAGDGSINEVDALILGIDRVYLIEIKNWSGEISGTQNTWTIRHGKRERFEENPLLLANRKAKKLKSLLASQPAFKKLRVPFIQAAVFLSSRNCTVRLDEIASQHVYLRPDGKREGKASIADLIIGDATRAENRPILGREIERNFCRAMDQLGLRQPSSCAQVGDYRLVNLLAENDRFQDWEARHARLDSDHKRIRIFTHSQEAADSVKRERKDLAKREYELLLGIQHEGILTPSQLTETEAGPALIYDYTPEFERLDHFLESDKSSFSTGQRLDLIRQIAEALQFAHKRNVYHRALSPWSIDVRSNKNSLRARLRDWQSGSSSTDTPAETRMTVDTGARAGLLTAPQAGAYTAPEVLCGRGLDATSIDIFSLGALTYAIFTDQAPAADADELFGKLSGSSGLLISEALDGAPDSLQELVQLATDPNPSDRPATVAEFLDYLNAVEDDLTTPDVSRGKHPLDAGKGDTLTGGFKVQERLGSGSICVALAVERDGMHGVLKIAKEASLNERVRTEATVLKGLRHPNIVQWLDEFEIDGLATIFMEQAGDKSLDQRLRSEGRLSLDLLERFGDELLNVLVYLEREGINHRDIKPVNIGIGTNRKRALTLKLFDFSLTRAPADNIRAGTPPYLDPFIAQRKPPRWDLYAERFAATMTLYEMATGMLPSWGDEGSDPRSNDEETRLDTELFDPALRDALTDFFTKGLRRDAKKRFDNADEMHLAWREAFQQIDQRTTQDEDTDTDGDSITVDLATIDDLDRSTKLPALGLSARELNAADRMGATTVGELLDLPGIRMYRNRGIGQRVVRRLRDLRKQLATHLSAQLPPSDSPDEPPETLSIDRLVNSLTGIKLDQSQRSIVDAWLGLSAPPDGDLGDLPTLREAGESAGATRSEAQRAIDTAIEKWMKNRWMTVLRDQVADFIRRKEGIVTVAELSARLLAVRGSSAWDSHKRQRAASAVVQAAMEAESTRENARFTLYRGKRSALVIATNQLGAAFSDASTARAQYAENLALAAEALAQEEPLPSPRQAENAMASVVAPARDEPISVDRRLRLAVANAADVALSSRLEIYPVGLSAERALRMGSNALLGPKRLPVEHLKNRIQSRFPHADRLPDRPALDDLLKAAEIPLYWEPAVDKLPAGYAPRMRGDGLTRHTSTLRRQTTATTAGADTPQAEGAQRFEDTITRALKDKRVLIVTCALSRLETAAQALAERFELQSVSLDRLLIGAMHEQAKAASAEWRIVLNADATAHNSADWRRLNVLVNRAVPEVHQTLQENAKPLLIQHLGLLVRYGHIGLIQSLRDAAAGTTQPARILLIPGDKFTAPALDATVLPVITPADWTHLPRAWLENRHRARATDQNLGEASA